MLSDLSRYLLDARQEIVGTSLHVEVSYWRRRGRGGSGSLGAGGREGGWVERHGRVLGEVITPSYLSVALSCASRPPAETRGTELLMEVG